MHHPWHLILGFLCSVSANAEESHSEGLSSTSLLDLPPSHLRGVDSVEHEVEGYQEPDIIQEFLHTHQGSGFSSQETEESAILQSSQLFNDDEERRVNGTSDSNSALQTDYPTTTFSDGTIHGENRSNSPNQNQETSTSWLSTDSGELPRHVSTKTLAEEENIHPATNHSDVSEHPEHEWTVFTVTSGTPEQPTPRPPRKTKKHSTSRKHHANHNPKSVPQTEHPLDSLLNVDDTHAFLDEDIKSMPTHTTQENVNLPKLFTQWDKSSTQKVVPTELQWGSEQVICNDWINLAGKNYVILNMSDDIDCEQFRWQKGQQLLSLLEEALSWKAETPQKDWVISLSKPNENDNHLLMTITEEQRVVPIKDVFTALGDIKRSLAEIGIESYSSTVVCESRPNQPRSDYGKLFIVLVIIGSVCVMIIIAGIIYICWQRRLPKLKNMELHFVENGCHDNPTLDVATDAQSEMQEKKTSLNGGTSHRADGWETLINTNSKEETEAVEEDTHL